MRATRAISIFERIGLGGGGKIKAVFHRMNALAEVAEFDPVVLNIHHGMRQKLNFEELRTKGLIAPRVRNLTLPEACHAAALAHGVQPFADFPAHDELRKNKGRIQYFKDGARVMVDKTEETPLGVLTKRTVPDAKGSSQYRMVNGVLYQLTRKNPDGSTETTDYAQGLPIRWTKTQAGAFVVGKNLITGTVYRRHRMFVKSFFELIDWEGAVVFFDGVTSAYLAESAGGGRALFLHADHRGPTGDIVPRSQFLIENFSGEAIITSTNVHKAQIEADLKPAAPVHVIPHFCETVPAAARARRDLVTVSRLDLEGKPIHESIAAFCLIKHAFPDVNYHIYGVGAGRKILEKQIALLDCADRVHLAGYTTDVASVFQGALASVYPTTTEGFGLSILEALSNGCPVISYDVNYGPREMIVSGANGELVAAGDIEATAHAMRQVLSEQATYRAGVRIGLERYSRNAYLANYYQMTKKLAGWSTRA